MTRRARPPFRNRPPAPPANLLDTIGAILCLAFLGVALYLTFAS